MTLTVGSLFSGIGGLDLGLERAGMSVLWQVEKDPYAQKVLRKHWPRTQILDDVCNVHGYPGALGHCGACLPNVDLICGGFPCQDLSSANTNGKRKRLNGDKSGLWAQYKRIVDELTPAWVVVENVANGWRDWVPAVRRQLRDIGYASLPIRLRASDFGAPHERPRVFVIAHAYSDREPLRAVHAQMASVPPIPGAGWDWRSPPPGGFRVDDGTAAGMDRLRCLGNAVVPQVAEYVGRLIVAAHTGANT